MKKNGGKLIFCSVMLILLSLDASAKGNRYSTCRQMASAETGYYGPVPTVYAKKLNLFKGAAKGAFTGALIGKIGGNSANNAAKKGAALGGLAALIKHEKSKKKAKRRNKRNRKIREAYSMELNACMSG